MGKDDRRTLSDVQNLRVSTTNGTFVRLGDIADVTLSSARPVSAAKDARDRLPFMRMLPAFLPVNC